MWLRATCYRCGRVIVNTSRRGWWVDIDQRPMKAAKRHWKLYRQKREETDECGLNQHQPSYVRVI